MNIKLKVAIKPGERFDGGKWFSLETLYSAIDYFLSDNKKNCFLCKGNGISGKQINSISVNKESRIGVIQYATSSEIIVDINRSLLPDNILSMLDHDIFEVIPRLVITKIDDETNEILSMIIISYDLQIKESTK